MAPRALMQTSQTVLHSPITFRPLSQLWSNLCPLSVTDSARSSHSFGTGATSPTLTCVCTLACTVPHTHDRAHSLSRSHSHSHIRNYNRSNHSHFTRTSPMPRHRGHSHIILALKPARTVSHSFSRYCVCYATDRTRSRWRPLFCTIVLAVRVATSPIALARVHHPPHVNEYATSSIAQPPLRTECTSICKFVAPRSRLQLKVEVVC